MSWLTFLSGGSVSPKLANEVTNTWNNLSAFSLIGPQRTRAGMQIDENTAMNYSTVFACTRARAETIATLPAIVYETLSDESRKKARQSMAWRLLHDRPNPDMTPVTFYEIMTTRMLNRGAAYAEIQRDGQDKPVALWPLHPTRVVPWRSWDGTIEFHCYLDAVNRDNPRGFSYYVIPRRDVFVLPGFGSHDGITGPGIVRMAAESIGLAMAAQAYGSTWFGNGARPSGIVEHPGFIKDDTRRKNFRDDLNKIHQGVENWNRVGILWDGAKWSKLEVTPEESQFLGTREFQDEEICRWYNVPPALVQNFKNFKFSTVFAMIQHFVSTAVRSDAVRWETAIKQQVLTAPSGPSGLETVDVFGAEHVMEFALEALLRGDPQAQADADTKLLSWGLRTHNELRRRDNYNPVEGGDTVIVPANFTTLEKLATAEDGPAADPVVPPPGGPPAPPADGDDDGEGAETEPDDGEGAETEPDDGETGDGEGSPETQLPQWSKSRQLISQALQRLAREAGESQPDNSAAIREAKAAAVRGYAQEILDESLSRMSRLEGDKAEAAAKRPGQWLTWVEEFYGRWPATLADALRTGTTGWLLATLEAPGSTEDRAEIGIQSERLARRLASGLCTDARQQLIAAADGDPQQFAARVAAVAAGWLARRIRIDESGTEPESEAKHAA